MASYQASCGNVGAWSHVICVAEQVSIFSVYNLEEPRPRSSRSTRVVRYRDVPRPCNPQSEERVFEIFNELFANAARINHLENMPRDDSRSGEISVSFDAPAPSITERLFTSQDTNESTAKDNTQPVKKTESKPKRIKIKNAIDRLEV